MMGASTAFRPANSPYLPAPMPSPPSYQGMPAQNGIQPLGAPQTGPNPVNPYGVEAISAPTGPQSSGFYQQPYPQPPQYLPFGSGTTMGPTGQHPDMKDFNFMSPGGQQQAPQQPAQALVAQPAQAPPPPMQHVLRGMMGWRAPGSSVGPGWGSNPQVNPSSGVNMMIPPGTTWGPGGRAQFDSSYSPGDIRNFFSMRGAMYRPEQ